MHLYTFSWLVLSLLLVSCSGNSNTTTQNTTTQNIPDTGMYVSALYSEVSIKKYLNITYSTRSNEGGTQYTSEITKAAELNTTTLALNLDVAVPPNATASKAQPLLVLIHGGGFTTGGKEDTYIQAISYARAGYVVASINYRLTPNNQQTAALRLKAIQQASDDAMNAIRFLKSNAATYYIDTTRVATIGFSAGGAISLINAVEFDTLTNTVSDFVGITSKVDAALSTGATLVENGYDSSSFLHYSATDTPVLLFHANPSDSVTAATWNGNVVPTQALINNSGNVCEIVAQADMTHTVDLSLGGSYWSSLKPFLWINLRLSSL